MFPSFRNKLALVGIAAGLALPAALGAAMAQTAAPAPLPEPIYWKQDLFLIPYQLTGGSAGFAQSVRLLISQDRGLSWSTISEAKPHVKAFNYRAPGEGEYWFAVRTIDSAGRAWPTAANQPELRVVVDKTPPRVDALRAHSRGDGVLEISWTEHDAFLNPAASRVELQAEIGGAWIPAAVQPAANSPEAGGGAARQVTWKVPSDRPPVMVRVRVIDLAGNSTEVICPVESPASPAGPLAAAGEAPPGWTSAPGQSLADSRSPLAGATASENSAQPWPAQPAPVSAYRLFDHALNVPADGVTRYGNPLDARNGAPTAGAADDRYAAGPQFSPLEPFRQAALRRLPQIGEVDPARAVPLPGPSAAVSAPVHADQPVKRPAETGFDPPPGIVPKQVAARTFALEYELSDLGRNGVTRIELWGTENGGKTWRRFAHDDDLRSPVVVTVEEEWLYGFCIVAESAGGMPASPPQAGQTPDLWVRVDLHRPWAELTEIGRGKGNQADHLVLRWLAEDDNLLARPVSLFYSSRPSGPWSVIAAELENTGEYSWRVERHVPERCYLRLEVRDAAGNRSAFQTLEPIELEAVDAEVKLRNEQQAQSLPGGSETR